MSKLYAPKAEDNPWRLDTFMNVDEWKEVSRWYPFSLRSLMPDSRWYEYSRSRMREEAYQIMRALAVAKPRHYLRIMQGCLYFFSVRAKVPTEKPRPSAPQVKQVRSGACDESESA
jgi:hypothetical protein